MDVQQIIEHYLYAFSGLNRRLMNDIGVCIADKEKVLLYQPARTLDLKIAPGQAYKRGSAIYHAIRENRRIVVNMDASLLGVPYIAVATPIVDETNQVIGAVAISESTQRYEFLKQASSDMGLSIETIAGTTEEISAQTEEMAASGRILEETVAEFHSRVRETDKVLKLIKDIAVQINLLGLNAAIEAARVGEQGLGFGVVATEIRKLSATTAESTRQIEIIINTIRRDSESTHEKINQLVDMLQQIALASTQIADANQNLTVMSSQLNNLAGTLLESP